MGFATALAVATSAAYADDPKFVFAKKAEELKDIKPDVVEWKATAEAGAVFTTGNSENTNVTAGIKASRKEGDNKLQIEASAAYAKSSVRGGVDMNGNGTIDDSTEIVTVETLTAETLASKVRYDRFLTDANSLFIAAFANRDVPAGKLSVVGGQAGYSRQLYKTKTAETLGEFGYDFSREHLVGGSPALQIHSARLFVGHHAVLTEGTVVDAAVELLTNLNSLNLPTHQDGSAFQDTRVTAKLAISAKIGANLAFQASLEEHYDHRPAPLNIKMLAPGFVPAAEPLDTIMKAQLIYTFAGGEVKKPPPPPPPPPCPPPAVVVPPVTATPVVPPVPPPAPPAPPAPPPPPPPPAPPGP